MLATPPSEQLPLYQRFVEHTEAHFAQEERWMLATGFEPDNCHASHHATILETLHAAVPHYQNDAPDIIPRLSRQRQLQRNRASTTVLAATRPEPLICADR